MGYCPPLQKKDRHQFGFNFINYYTFCGNGKTPNVEIGQGQGLPQNTSFDHKTTRFTPQSAPHSKKTGLTANNCFFFSFEILHSLGGILMAQVFFFKCYLDPP